MKAIKKSVDLFLKTGTLKSEIGLIQYPILFILFFYLGGKKWKQKK